jgi:hypothetical protein
MGARSLAGVAGGTGATGSQTAETVGARMFALRDSVWIGLGKANRISVTAVSASSPAYFGLVRMLPELTPYLSAREDVVVAGESWTPGEVAALVRNFRGT